MQLIKPVLDFMMNEAEVVYEDKDTNKNISNFKILVKVPMEGNKFINVYERDSLNEADTLSGVSTRFVFLYDIEKNSIVYTNRIALNNSGYSYYSTKYIENVTDKDVREMKMVLDNVQKHLSASILDKMNQLEEKVLSKIDLSKYEEKAKDLYLRKEVLPNPFERKHYTITPSLINLFFNDYDEFVKESYNQINDDDFELYEKYVGMKYAIKAYEEELTSDPICIRKKAICDIINDEKYKTITVNYKLPNNVVLSEKINKTRVYNDNIKRTIMEEDHLQHIPVLAVQSITWSKRELYNTKDYPELTLSKDDELFEYAKAGSMTSIPSEYFSDKDFMKKVLLYNPNYINYLDKSLRADKDFILDIVKDTDNIGCYRIFAGMNDALKTDEVFMVNFLIFGLKDDLPKGDMWNRTYRDFIIDIANKTLAHSKHNEIMYTTINKVGVDDVGIVNTIPKAVWNTERVANILAAKGVEDRNVEKIIGFFDDTKNIKKIFSTDQLKRYIDSLSSTAMDDRDLMIELLSDKEEPARCNSKNINLIDKYKEDKTIVDLIANNIYMLNQAQNYYKVIFPCYDSEDLFALTDKNIIFFEILHPDDKQTFIDGEFFDINDLTVSTQGNCIYIQSPNLVFALERFGQITMLKDNRRLAVSSCKGELISKIMNVLSEKYPECKATDFKTRIAQIVKFEEEKINKEEIQNKEEDNER